MCRRRRTGSNERSSNAARRGGLGEAPSTIGTSLVQPAQLRTAIGWNM